MIEKPVAKLTAAVVIVGGLGALFALDVSSEILAVVGAIIGSAATYLFMTEK